MGKETFLQELLIFRPIEKAFRNIYQIYHTLDGTGKEIEFLLQQLYQNYPFVQTFQSQFESDQKYQ